VLPLHHKAIFMSLRDQSPDGRSRFTDAKLGMICEACKFLSNFFTTKFTHPYIAADYT